MKRKFSELLSRFAFPVVLIVLGLVLTVDPDSASILVAKVFGWALCAVGVGFLIAAFTSHAGMVGRVLGAVACFVLGGWLLRDPMLLARGAGRIVGLLLIVRGGQELFASNYPKARLLSLLVLLLGVVLVALPMTTSRVVFTLLGAVVLVMGVFVLIDRLRDGPRQGGKPDIIDVE